MGSLQDSNDPSPEEGDGSNHSQTAASRPALPGGSDGVLPVEHHVEFQSDGPR